MSPLIISKSSQHRHPTRSRALRALVTSWLKQHTCRNPRSRVGRWGERIARKAVERAGHIPLKTNWRSHRGEVDIITLERRTLVIIEVKTRHIRLQTHHAALRAVHTKKRLMLSKTRHAFLRNNGPLCRRHGVKHTRTDAIEVYYSRTRFGFFRVCEVKWHRGLSTGLATEPRKWPA